MEQSARKRGDRYAVSGSVETQYVDDAGLVMVNKRGVTDLVTLQELEREALAHAYDTLLCEVRADTVMTCELLRYIHRQIFGDLYEWAGRWRTVWVSKPGTTWPAPDFLERHMAAWEQNVLGPHDQADDRPLGGTNEPAAVGIRSHGRRPGAIRPCCPCSVHQRVRSDARGHSLGLDWRPAAIAASSLRTRSRDSGPNGGSPSMTLFRSVTSRIRSIRSAASRKYGQVSINGGPFPNSLITILYDAPPGCSRPVFPAALSVPRDQGTDRSRNRAAAT